MARVMRLVDDLDPTREADRTVVFAMDGVVYSIDLAEDNIGPMRKAMEPYMTAGRRVARLEPAVMRAAGGNSSAKAAAKPKAIKASNAEIRNWAAEVEMDCPTRGRIPADVRDAYNRAHGG